MGAAAALATLIETQKLNVADNAAARGDELLAGCRGLQDRHEIVGDVRGKGLMVCLELVADRDSKEPVNKSAMETVLRTAYREGVMIRISGNNIIISPSLIITDQHVAAIVAALDAGLTSVAQK